MLKSPRFQFAFIQGTFSQWTRQKGYAIKMNYFSLLYLRIRFADFLYFFVHLCSQPFWHLARTDSASFCHIKQKFNGPGRTHGRISKLFLGLQVSSFMIPDVTASQLWFQYRVTSYVKHKVQRWVEFQYFHETSENRVNSMSVLSFHFFSKKKFELQKRGVMLNPKLPEVLRTKLAESLSMGVFSQAI